MRKLTVECNWQRICRYLRRCSRSGLHFEEKTGNWKNLSIINLKSHILIFFFILAKTFVFGQFSIVTIILMCTYTAYNIKIVSLSRWTVLIKPTAVRFFGLTIIDENLLKTLKKYIVLWKLSNRGEKISLN